MKNKLTGLITAHSIVHSINNIIKSSFKKLNEVFTCYARHTESTVKSKTELFFKHTVHTSDLLLFNQLKTIFTAFSSANFRVFSRCSAFFVHRAFVAHTAGTLQHQFFSVCTAHTADWTCISCHYLSLLNYMRRVLRGRQPL